MVKNDFSRWIVTAVLLAVLAVFLVRACVGPEGPDGSSLSADQIRSALNEVKEPEAMNFDYMETQE